MSAKRREPIAQDSDVEAPSRPTLEKALELVARALDGMRFGSVCLIVQDGVVVQLERNEKLRLDR